MIEAADLDQIVPGLSPEEKVGQLLLLGFDGASAANAEVALSDLHAGGIVLLNNGTSADAVKGLIAELRERGGADATLPFLIAIDHEGGTVQRLRQGVSDLGSNWEVGQVQPISAAVQAACSRGQMHGQELKSIGINLNLAPVLDVWDNPNNTVIATRSYSSDPERVAALGSAYIQGLQTAGVLATAKHFPGHGSTDDDSHFGLPVLMHDRARLDQVELVPFRAAIDAQVAAIMTAHVSYPLLDPTDVPRPATVSPVIIKGLLRGDLGYDGLVVTDDLGAMRAITDSYRPGDAAVQAIVAGADMVTIAQPVASQYAARDALLAAIGNELSETQLNASVRRVLAAKRKAGLLPGAGPSGFAYPSGPCAAS